MIISVRSCVVLAVGCGVLATTSCSGTTPGAATPGAATPTVTSAVDAASPAAAPGGAAPGGPVTVADVLARYPTCDAVGAVVASQIQGLELNEDDVEDDDVQCAWLSPIGAYAQTLEVDITSNNGAVDVPDRATIELAQQQYVPDAALEAAGGIAVLGQQVGDLRGPVTTVYVPGVTVTITQVKLGADSAFGGAPSVAAAKQLLGIPG